MKDYCFLIEGDGSQRYILQYALERKLMEMGLRWIDQNPSRINSCLEVGIEWQEEEKRWAICYTSVDNPIALAEAVITDKFDLKAWMRENTPKKKSKGIVSIDLSWLKGEAREVVSKAIQNVAFSKGYIWAGGCPNTSIHTTKPALYIFEANGAICYENKFIPHGSKEISVNQALRGEYESFSYEERN